MDRQELLKQFQKAKPKKTVIVGFDGKEVLLPIDTNEEDAIQKYIETGESLGRYDSIEEAQAARDQMTHGGAAMTDAERARLQRMSPRPNARQQMLQEYQQRKQEPGMMVEHAPYTEQEAEPYTAYDEETAAREFGPAEYADGGIPGMEQQSFLPDYVTDPSLTYDEKEEKKVPEINPIEKDIQKDMTKGLVAAQETPELDIKQRMQQAIADYDTAKKQAEETGNKSILFQAMADVNEAFKVYNQRMAYAGAQRGGIALDTPQFQEKKIDVAGKMMAKAESRVARAAKQLKELKAEQEKKAFTLSPGQQRFEQDPITGEVKTVASVDPKETATSNKIIDTVDAEDKPIQQLIDPQGNVIKEFKSQIKADKIIKPQLIDTVNSKGEPVQQLVDIEGKVIKEFPSYFKPNQITTKLVDTVDKDNKPVKQLIDAQGNVIKSFPKVITTKEGENPDLENPDSKISKDYRDFFEKTMGIKLQGNETYNQLKSFGKELAVTSRQKENLKRADQRIELANEQFALAKKKYSRLSDTQVKTMAGLDSTLKLLDTVETQSKGVTTGRWKRLRESIKPWTPFKEDLEFYELQQTSGINLFEYIKNTSGVQYSVQELAKMEANIPNVGDPEKVFAVKLANLKKLIEEKRTLTLDNYAAQDKKQIGKTPSVGPYGATAVKDGKNYRWNSIKNKYQLEK